MYSLSYEMMVHVLRQFGYSGEVQADVSSDSVLSRFACTWPFGREGASERENTTGKAHPKWGNTCLGILKEHEDDLLGY
jgi:hypothetical protein